MSPVLGCYGEKDANTPNIDQLVAKVSNSPTPLPLLQFCSPFTSLFDSGCPAPKHGNPAHALRFSPSSVFQWISGASEKEGYFNTNNVKTDYNSGNYEQIIEKSWHENSADAHWRKRSNKEVPFFSVFNLMTSHQSRSMVWSYEKFKNEIQSKLYNGKIHNPQKITLPPYYPDTPIVRKTVARFHDCVTAMDQQVGDILKQLKEDGLAGEYYRVFLF